MSWPLTDSAAMISSDMHIAERGKVNQIAATSLPPSGLTSDADGNFILRVGVTPVDEWGFQWHSGSSLVGDHPWSVIACGSGGRDTGDIKEGI